MSANRLRRDPLPGGYDTPCDCKQRGERAGTCASEVTLNKFCPLQSTQETKAQRDQCVAGSSSLAMRFHHVKMNEMEHTVSSRKPWERNQPHTFGYVVCGTLFCIFWRQTRRRALRSVVGRRRLAINCTKDEYLRNKDQKGDAHANIAPGNPEDPARFAVGEMPLFADCTALYNTVSTCRGWP